MPIPVKPCNGAFSEETVRLLTRNLDRAQWQPHACVVCGQMIGAKLDMGKWVPEAHWPSIPTRKAKAARAAGAGAAVAEAEPEGEAEPNAEPDPELDAEADAEPVG